MKLRIQKQLLAKHVGIVQKAISGRTPMPILEGILLECENNRIKMTGSDGEISIVTYADAFVEREGSIVIGSKLFGDIIRRLPNAMINIEVEEANMQIICEKSEFNILGQSTREYPSLPQVDPINSVTLKADLLREGIRRTSFAVSLDPTRLPLTGILLDIKRDSLSFVSLDGYRLSHLKVKSRQDFEREAILPVRSATELTKILEEDTEEITLLLSNNHLQVNLEQTVFYTKLINGDYFSYEGLIRTAHERKVTVKRQDFYNSLERAGLLAVEGKSNLVKLSLYREEMLIESNSDIGEVHEMVPCTLEGENLRIAFNSKYLMEGVRTMTGETITLQFTDAVNPCIIQSQEDEGYLYLILPVRLAN